MTHKIARHAIAAGDTILKYGMPIGIATAAIGAGRCAVVGVDELIIGTVCGGSDGTSGISGNPVAAKAFDLLVAEGAACIFEETGGLTGCEDILAARAYQTERSGRWSKGTSSGNFGPIGS